MRACKSAKSSGAATLNDYLARVRSKHFEWGVHDCAHFTLGGVEAQTGVWHEPPAYTNAREAFACFRKQSMSEWFDQRFERCPHVPPVGSIVVVRCDDAIIERAGLVVSDKAAFVSSSGLIFRKLQPAADKYWTVT